MVDRATDRPRVDVVICVHNSPDDVRACLASVLPTLGAGDRLTVVDDGSADETKRLCEEVAAGAPDRVRLIRRPEGSGFCRAANAGIRASEADIVVLLNSDTIVPAGWVERIVACMARHPRIGLVGPLSNAGGWQSIPSLPDKGVVNNRVRSDGETLAAIQAFCADFGARYDAPVVELLNGFCIAIRRTVLDEVGLLDDERFPQGYGEEWDLCFRAQDAGFLCAVAIDCFVYHEKTKSYTAAQRKELSRAGRAQLDARHGVRRVRDAVRGVKAHPILASVRADAQEAFLRNGWLRPEDPS